MSQFALSQKAGVVGLIILEIIFIILFALFVKYGANANATTGVVDEKNLDQIYPMFQDVHVMMFIGFGFLMTFLKRYGFSSVSFTMLLSCIVIQWGLLCSGFFRMQQNHIYIDIKSMIAADITAAVILISFGAVLGKTSPLQLIIMAVIETPIFCANEYLGTHVLQAVDAGGSMFVHAFGAYFGLTVSLLMKKKVDSRGDGNDFEGSNYQSDMMAMIGTVFLWLFWPSFNAGLVEGDDKHRAVINTYLALTASCITTFAVSALFNKNHKFDMVHIQNATLAGGVCVGTVADMMIQPYGAIIIGFLGGCLSTLGFRFVQGFLLRTIKLHDTCGVHNLHGMTGVFSGVAGAILSYTANEDLYGRSLYLQFKARAPSSPDQRLTDQYLVIEPGSNRSALGQAGIQMLALCITLIIAVVGGAVTALVFHTLPLDQPTTVQRFDDSMYWLLPDEESGNDGNENEMETRTGALNPAFDSSK